MQTRALIKTKLQHIQSDTQSKFLGIGDSTNSSDKVDVTESKLERGWSYRRTYETSDSECDNSQVDKFERESLNKLINKDYNELENVITDSNSEHQDGNHQRTKPPEMERTNTVLVNEMVPTRTDALREELRIILSISNDTTQDYHAFKSEIKLKYDALKKYLRKLEQFEKSCVLIFREYKLEQDQITHRFFKSTNEALKWSYRNKGLMEKKFPFILISNKFPNSLCSQVMRKKKAGVMVPGREASPKTEVTLLVPNSTFKPRKMVFFLDTGADGGSVG